MTRAHVVLLTEGGAAVGLGHVSRCLAIARAALAEGARVAFIAPPEPAVAQLLAGVSGRVLALDWPADPAGAVAAVRELSAEAVVVDSYKATPDFLAALRATGAAVTAVDDTAERALPVDVVVNGGAGAAGLPYRRAGDTVFLLGPRYALLDPSFADLPHREPAARVRRILVTLGGGLNTDDVAAAVRAADRVLDGGVIDVAAGSFAAGAAELDALARGARNRVVVHRGRFGLRALMQAADLAVSGAGMTLYELAAAGTPAVTICMADNQVPNARGFADIGAAPAGGRAGDPALAGALERALACLAPAAARARVAERARALVDGRGAERVARHILAAAPARS